MIGDPVASNRVMVARMADSSAARNCSSEICPAARACMAVSNSAGRGMLPIGSVGMVIGFL
jgi:hypothetical protein